jgi:hypothetical protein
LSFAALSPAEIKHNAVRVYGVHDDGTPSANLSITDVGVKTDPSGYFRSHNVTRTTSASVATTSVQIIDSNPNRRCLYIWNNSSNSAYITFGPVSSGSAPTAIVASFTSFVMNSGVIYTGAISAIRNSGAGTMTVTECIP